VGFVGPAWARNALKTTEPRLANRRLASEALESCSVALRGGVYAFQLLRSDATFVADTSAGGAFAADARPESRIGLRRPFVIAMTYNVWHMRSARMNLRLAADADERIRRAAEASGVSTSVFVERAASAAADAVLADRREFRLSAEDWERFVAELDRPARDLPELRRGVKLRDQLT
jgi:uncharacterized protein (DUF1778 family)